MRKLSSKTVGEAEKLLVAISELESDFDIKIKKFPKIVVLGDQSSGKTSVTEGVAGRSFMPKRMGMATEKPMEIITLKSDEVKFVIRDKEVHSEKEASELVDSLNSNPSVAKIHIKLYGPDLYNSCITDLPGLFYVSKGNKELPAKIKAITEEYLKDRDNTPVIVISATQDPATNQVIQLISEYDRDDHSLGVITKLDLTTDNNTSHVEDMLKGRIEDFRLGHSWVCVVLKSKKENDAGMTVAEKMVEEEAFFAKNQQFSPAGVRALREKISEIQFGKIRDNLPEIAEEIAVKIKDLELSDSFMEQVLSDPKKKLVKSVETLVQKLVGSSIDRAEFEESLKQKCTTEITSYIDQTFESSPLYVPELSTQSIDSSIFSYHQAKHTNPKMFEKDNFKELFSFGLVSPLLVNPETIEKAFLQESALACAIPMFHITIDDPRGKKKSEWNKQLQAYIDNLASDNNIQNIIFQITIKELLNYIGKDLNKDDLLTKKFAEYIIKEIGSEAYESKIKFSITAMINTEKRPHVSTMELCRHLTQLYSNQFIFKGGLIEHIKKNKKKLKVEAYSEPFNRAYLRAVGISLSENAYRNVSVNLLDPMVLRILEVFHDITRPDNSGKEKSKVSGKIKKLKEIQGIINSYQNSQASVLKQAPKNA